MKTSQIRAFALSSLAILPFISCQKTISPENRAAQAVITRTISADAETIATNEAPGAKSVYEEGIGVHLTGEEYMSVYYAKNDGNEAVGAMTAVVGTPDGEGKWSFTHDAIEGATSYDYAFLLPYTSKNEMPSNKTQFKFRLLNVQNPTATSFDPNVDFLLGQTRFGVDKADAVSEVKFKRIFAPVKLEISDGAGILGTEKVHAVTFSLSQAATKTDALAGLLYLTPGTSDYESAYTYTFATDKNNNVPMNNFSNSVSALIAGGVGMSGGVYPVWYIMSPMEIAAGTQVTVCVTTESKTVTRTATLKGIANIEREKINVIPFDISGEGYSVENSAHCNFTAVSDFHNAYLVMTDSSTPFTPSYCNLRKDTEQSNYPQSLQMNTNEDKDSNIQIAPKEGKRLTKVRIYTNHLIGFNSAEISLKDGDTTLDSNQITYGNVAPTGGYADFEVPESSGSSTLTIYAGVGIKGKGIRVWFSGITLFYE